MDKRPVTDQEAIRAMYLLDIEIRSCLELSLSDLSEAAPDVTVNIRLGRLRQLLMTGRSLARRLEFYQDTQTDEEALALLMWMHRPDLGASFADSDERDRNLLSGQGLAAEITCGLMTPVGASSHLNGEPGQAS